MTAAVSEREAVPFEPGRVGVRPPYDESLLAIDLRIGEIRDDHFHNRAVARLNDTSHLLD